MIKNETIYSDTTFVEKAMGSMFCSFLYFDFNYSSYCKFIWGNVWIQSTIIRNNLYIFFCFPGWIYSPHFICSRALSWYESSKARLKYTFSFYGFVDFVAVIPCILTYVYWNTEVVHIIILPYIFIIFKLIRHSRSFRVIGKALASVKEELETAYTASFITICFSAILMYYIERSAQPEVFENIGDGIWWAIITFATVGYGDIYPITPLGKLLGCIICLVGVAMVAIPTGIISSSFINIVQKKRRNKGRTAITKVISSKLLWYSGVRG